MLPSLYLSHSFSLTLSLVLSLCLDMSSALLIQPAHAQNSRTLRDGPTSAEVRQSTTRIYILSRIVHIKTVLIMVNLRKGMRWLTLSQLNRDDKGYTGNWLHQRTCLCIRKQKKKLLNDYSPGNQMTKPLLIDTKSSTITITIRFNQSLNSAQY